MVFVVGSLFWFPWIFSTVGDSSPLHARYAARVEVSSIAWWYAHNLTWVFLGFAGLASSFYFIPKLLRSRAAQSAACGSFLSGPWRFSAVGAEFLTALPCPPGSPASAWSALSLTCVPLIAIAINFVQTARHNVNTLDSNPTLRFTYIGLLFLYISAAQQLVGVLPQVSAITSLTWFGVAQKELFVLGFFRIATSVRRDLLHPAATADD